ncbi:MAG: hypothetical protein AB8G86_14720 [Saprospiraceae bacterium]
MTRYFLLLFCFVLLSNCATQQNLVNPYAHIADQKVVTLLKKSFTTSGGLTNWRNKKELHYQKHGKLIFESGEIESEVIQQHDYVYEQNTSININWQTADNKTHQIKSVDWNAVKYIDGQIDHTPKTSSLNTTVNVAHFVIDVPFKMMDKGVALSYEGMDTLEDGQKVEVIKAIYNADTNAHHTKSDIWWYYFDAKDSRMVAYFIKHDGRYSYIKNLSYTKAGGFLFPKARGSYRVDKDRNILFTRAEYAYSNWKVK